MEATKLAIVRREEDVMASERVQERVRQRLRRGGDPIGMDDLPDILDPLRDRGRGQERGWGIGDDDEGLSM